MSVRENIIRYHLIISKLRKQNVSYNELKEYLERESEFYDYDFVKSKRTIQRDLNDIRSIYNIDIRFDFRQGVYTMDPDDNQEKNLRMVEALDLFNALKVTEKISGVIHFEKRRPQGTENLNGLLHAIQNRLQINFIYSKFWEEIPTVRIAEPRALKEFKNRWYLLAVDHNVGKMKTFALDRLSNLDITQRKFQHKTEFNVSEYFKDCFGIIAPNDKLPEEVILSFNYDQGKYIKSLPLHHSQQILIDNNNELRIKLNLVITFDFVMEILSFGANVKVFQPKTLIDEIKNEIQNALKQYN